MQTYSISIKLFALTFCQLKIMLTISIPNNEYAYTFQMYSSRWFSFSCRQTVRLQNKLFRFLKLYFSFDVPSNIFSTTSNIIFMQFIGGKATHTAETGSNTAPVSNVHIRDGYNTLQRERDKTRPLTLHITQPSTPAAGTLRLYSCFFIRSKILEMKVLWFFW